MKKEFLLLALALTAMLPVSAQNEKETGMKDEPKTEKLDARISGRFLLDGLGYLKAPEGLNHQVNITDLRLTGKVTYGDWFMRIDVGFDGNKLGLKDTFLQYAKKDNYFRIGHMIGAFGIDPAISTYDYLFTGSANVTNLFYFGRHVGAAYLRSKPKYYVSADVFVGDNISNIRSTVKQGFNVSARGVYRPVLEEDRVLQIGVSGLFRRPDMDKETGIRNITLAATGVTCLKSPDYQHISIDQAKSQSQVNAEFYMSWKKWMVQAEYMAMFIDRQNAAHYMAQGGYVQAGYMILGKSFGYDSTEALPTAPAQPKSLQLVARYNISCLNDAHAGLKGGNQQDISVGLNYQFNKHICSRVNYSYVNLDDGSPLGAADLHMIQARVAFWF